ncbi:hypothetical protein [Kitasatospora phosalacinea]|uniref:hypothetical protein n=1 Tax=Kitasatospora phosalacinea TaxID=2065 RepID=UPI000690DE7D|nr:hypothetical protein [Kitasatospora phosalacinea]
MTEGRTDRPGEGPSGGAGHLDEGPPGPLTEELLRARLHRAVAAVEPEPGALPRLRAAVPRRRAVRRRALGGAVVLAAAIAALPVVNATGPFDLSGDPTGGQAAPSQGASQVKTPGGRTGHPHTYAGTPSAGSAAPSPEASASPSATGTPGAPLVAAPVCSRTDLGRAAAEQATADPADGEVYGWFRLTNTAGRACRVTGPGRLALGAGATGVQLLAHTAGDPAGSLPDPAALPAEVLLGPGGSYLVRFAWVPARCPTASESPTGAGGSQQPSAGDSAAAMGPADAAPGPTPASVEADPTPTAEPSSGAGAGSPTAEVFALGYAPDQGAAGAPVGTTLPVGCGGAVYWTGPELDQTRPVQASPSATP